MNQSCGCQQIHKGNCEDEYICQKCHELWGFFPFDYEFIIDYPTICPLCNMPLRQAVKEIWQEEGLLAVFSYLNRRLTIRSYD